MTNPPRIWLDYRPIRIGWVVDEPNLATLVTAGGFNTCLWGGRYNPIIPCRGIKLATALIKLFRVDALLPVEPSDATAAFIQAWPQLRPHIWSESIFNDGHCALVDIRHAIKRTLRVSGLARDRFIRPTWMDADPLAPLFSLMFGSYPDPATITIDYVRGIRSVLAMPDRTIDPSEPLVPELLEFATPMSFTGFDLSIHRGKSPWLEPGIVFGDATSFDDLLFFWNLRVAGAQVCFFDEAHLDRLKPILTAFLAAVCRRPAKGVNQINFWSRASEQPSPEWTTVFDTAGLAPRLCRAEEEDDIWNGGNVRPVRPEFSAWHRDVVSSYIETEDRVSATFALPDRPFDDDDPHSLDQHYVVTVDAQQYGAGLDDRTFATPFVPRLTEFYGRNFYGSYDEARVELGSSGRGAIGIITTVGAQQLTINAISTHRWIKAFFNLFDIEVERSEAGRRCSRLIRQMGGLQGCRAFKVRGARDLIDQYSPDQSFMRSAAETMIGNLDPQTMIPCSCIRPRSTSGPLQES
jgi:hypothetical protein